MNMDNFVDLLDNNSNSAATASALAAAASAAAGRRACHHHTQLAATGCHWLPSTHCPARGGGATAWLEKNSANSYLELLWLSRGSCWQGTGGGYSSNNMKDNTDDKFVESAAIS